MSDYQDENPYASPEGAAEPAVPEIHGIWRDGDELVVLPRDMKAPKACWVTNKTGFVSRCYLNSHSRAGLALSTLIFIPLIGVVLYPIVSVLFAFFGHLRIRPPVAWLGWGVKMRQGFGAGVGGVLFLIAFMLSSLAGISTSLTLLLMAVPFMVAGLLVIVWGDRLLIGLHTRYGEKGTYRIRGVHPDYLARLPEYNELDTTAATAIEPGGTPFSPPVS